MGQSQSVPSISNGSPSDSKKSSSASSNPARSEKPELPRDLITLREGNAEVEHLAIYRHPLNQNQGTLTHHFLIVRIARIEKVITTVRYIKAEKNKGGANDRGEILISCDGAEFDPADIPEKHGLAMEGCGVIPVQKLTDILQVHTSNYSLLKHNCWKYADETFRLLITEFLELPDTTSEAKQRLQSYLDELAPLRLPGHVFDFHWGWVWAFFTGAFAGASVFAYYAGTAAAAATAASVPKLIPVGLGLGLPVAPTFATHAHLYLLLAGAKSAGMTSAAGGAVPHGLAPILTMLLKHVLLGLPLKKIGILGGMALAYCPHVLIIVIGVFGGVGIVSTLVWVLYKIVRALPGNANPDSGLSKFLARLDSMFASMFALILSGFKRFLDSLGSCFAGMGRRLWGWMKSWFTGISSWFKARPTEGTLVVAAH